MNAKTTIVYHTPNLPLSAALPAVEIETMDIDPTRRVVVWLHLADREEVGDFLIREVWKTVELRPHGVADYCGQCVPLYEDDVPELLSMSDQQLEEELFRRLGVTSRASYVGIPKGPYYDTVDLATIRNSLKRVLP